MRLRSVLLFFAFALLICAPHAARANHTHTFGDGSSGDESDNDITLEFAITNITGNSVVLSCSDEVSPPPVVPPGNSTVSITVIRHAWDEYPSNTQTDEITFSISPNAGGSPATQFDDEEITFVPADAGIPDPPSGPVDTISVPAAVASFSPTSGSVGTAVTISGMGFTGATKVSFGGTPATTFSVVSDTQITATVPSGAVSGPVSVTLPGGTITSSGSFTIGKPAITGFSPASGPVGTAVTITGTNLTGTTVVGFQNAHATSFTVNGAGTQITTTVPSGAITGPVAVLTPGGEAKSSTNFTVTTAPAKPTITGFTPSSGPIGTAVTITGTNLTGTTVVGFQNAHATSFTVNGAGTQITTTVPSGAVTGPVAVLTPGGEAKSSTNFTVAAVPTITSFSPTSGPIGSVLTIVGTNLNGVTAVKFHYAYATTFSANAQGTQITVTIPSGAATGTIKVTTPGGSATTTADFTITNTPTITGFSPASGPVGTAVTITGTNLTGATVVGFQNAHATSFTVNGAGTQITTTVPSGAVTGPIAVLTPGGEAKSSTIFTVTP